MNARFAVLGLLCITACGSYKKDLTTMCEAPKKAGIPPEMNPADTATIMAAWIQPKLGSSEGKALFKKLPTLPVAERGKVLHEESQHQGIATCAFADFFDQNVTK